MFINVFQNKKGATFRDNLFFPRKLFPCFCHYSNRKCIRRLLNTRQPFFQAVCYKINIAKILLENTTKPTADQTAPRTKILRPRRVPSNLSFPNDIFLWLNGFYQCTKIITRRIGELFPRFLKSPRWMHLEIFNHTRQFPDDNFLRKFFVFLKCQTGNQPCVHVKKSSSRSFSKTNLAKTPVH